MQTLDHALSSRTPAVIGVVGPVSAWRGLARVFADETFSGAFPWVTLAGAVVNGRGDADATGGGVENDSPVPVYGTVEELLAAHETLSFVLDLTQDPEHAKALQETLPDSVEVLSGLSAALLLDALSSDKHCETCERDLAYTRSLFTTIFDEVEEDIILMDKDGRIVDMNKNAYERKQTSKEELLGTLCWELEGREFCCEHVDGVCPLKQTLQTGKKSENVHSFVDEKGRMRFFRVYTYPIFSEDRALTHVMEIRRDITRRTNLEQRLQQTEKMAAIGELSTYIAHEIRNPLFAIGGFANSLLRSDSLDDTTREKVSIILEESKRLDKILKSTLNFARPTEAKEGQVDLNKVVKETMNLLNLGLERKGIHLTVDTDDHIAMVKGDPELLKQCLINMVKNAIEAMPDGGNLAIQTGFSGKHIFLNVEDTGRGIPKDFRIKVFNPFFSTKEKGAGLGLAMTKKIIEEMGGEVELHSSVDHGTKVSLLLLPVLADEPDVYFPTETLE